jgi:glycosyltransferase involved in cell wall biosynthesis
MPRLRLPESTYAVVTPVLNERENLDRLEGALSSQTVAPLAWVIVDTGSEDGGIERAEALAGEHPWIRTLAVSPGRARGGPIVRAFNAGLSAVPRGVDVVVKVDADVSFEHDYFARLLEAFAAEPRLGIASGACLEIREGEWRPRHVTAGNVWGACRAYRLACLEQVSPLEERMGWDGIDVLKASARGWRTGLVDGLTFRHHRGEGSRDGSRFAPWIARGRVAHYMGYRPSFLVIRALRHTLSNPAAIMMIAGWAKPALAREPACSDETARAYLRRQQRLRELPKRAREALGMRAIGRADQASRP